MGIFFFNSFLTSRKEIVYYIRFGKHKKNVQEQGKLDWLEDKRRSIRRKGYICNQPILCFLVFCFVLFTIRYLCSSRHGTNGNNFFASLVNQKKKTEGKLCFWFCLAFMPSNVTELLKRWNAFTLLWFTRILTPPSGGIWRLCTYVENPLCNRIKKLISGLVLLGNIRVFWVSCA